MEVESPVLKYRPEEFLVAESLLLPTGRLDKRSGGFTYLKLKKSGFTTFEAVEHVARFLRVEPTRVLYAGLKDEDAITEQLIAVDTTVGNATTDLFNAEHSFPYGRFLEMSLYGTGDEPIQIGRLSGNSFRIVVRRLSKTCADQLERARRQTLFFLNYYDTQRFGVADGPKTTHCIGEALAQKDLDTAFEYLKLANSPEAKLAAQFAGTAEEFFRQLDSRVLEFYRSSYESFIWNRELATVVRDVCGRDAREVEVDTIPFVLAQEQTHVISVLQRCRVMAFPGGAAGARHARRATVVQTQYFCGAIQPDEVYPNTFKCEVSFFLSSGCYATMCVRQLVNMRDLVP